MRMTQAMTPATRRLVLWSVPLALLVAALVLAFRPQPMAVDMVTIGRAPLTVTVGAEGRTRVRDIYRVSAPVAGEVQRLPVVVGDAVTGGDSVVATLQPAFAGFLDARAMAEAEGALHAAEAAAGQAAAELDRARSELDFARAELARATRLAADGTVPPRTLERARADAASAEAAMNVAAAAVEARHFDLEVARARLMQPEAGAAARSACCVTLRAPVDGRVLAVLHQDQAVVAAGTPLLEIGDPGALEVVVDFLSSDAVGIEPGMAAVLRDWGGPPLDAVVRRVEPAAFTKVSALGIEEQRVNVVLDLAPGQAAPDRLGHGFRVMVDVVIWHDDDVLAVPLGSLFRDGAHWAVFQVEDGIARRRAVEVGRMTARQAQVIDGLTPGDTLVLHPSDTIADGVGVEAR